METVENIYPPWDKTMKFAPEWIAKRDTLLYWTNSLPEYRIKEREQEKQWTWRKFLHFKFIKEFGHLNDIELKKNLIMKIIIKMLMILKYMKIIKNKNYHKCV